MSLFDIEQEQIPASQKLATGFLAEANAEFHTQLDRAYDAVDRFWNRGSEDPTGVEILTSLGVYAQAVMMVAYARVQMLVGIATALGKPELVDLSKLSPPYTLTFNPDGSLASAEPIEG